MTTVNQKTTLQQINAYMDNYQDLSPMELNHLKMLLEKMGMFVELELQKWGERIVR